MWSRLFYQCVEILKYPVTLLSHHNTGHLRCFSIFLQSWIHWAGLVVSWPWLKGGIWPLVWQSGCHSGAPRPPVGHWSCEGGGAHWLGRPVLLPAVRAFWQSEAWQVQKWALLGATTHFDLPTSWPCSTGNVLLTSWRVMLLFHQKVLGPEFLSLTLERDSRGKWGP